MREYCPYCQLVVAPRDPDRVEDAGNGQVLHATCRDLHGKQPPRREEMSLGQKLKAWGLPDAQLGRLLARGSMELDRPRYEELVSAVREVVGPENHGRLHEQYVVPVVERAARARKQSQLPPPLIPVGTLPSGMMLPIQVV